MSTDGEAPGEKIATDETAKRREDIGAATAPAASRTGRVLGILAALIILAGGIYYFTDRRGGTEVATSSGPDRRAEGPVVASTPSPERSANPASPPQETTSVQPPPAQPPSAELPSAQPREPQQSPSASQPLAVAPPAETPAPPAAVTPAPAVPATTAQETATSSDAAKNQQPPSATTATPSTGSGAATQASSTAPSSMRDQPAALPDQPAAAGPKKENVLIVMRGPANIRSAPGKGGRVIATARKDATVKELDRSGNWVQVETEGGTGWINAALLGAPESRSSR